MKTFNALWIDYCQVEGMKAFISVDLEGMPFVVIPGHLNLKGSLYNEARKIATKVTSTVAEELNKNGFTEITVADSHGPMVNILIDDLPEYVDLIRGTPRPVCMVSGVEGCNVALFLGYHAKFGTAKSTWDHTYAGRIIHMVEVNGAAASEFLMNSYVAGEADVPVILVAGESQLLKDDVEQYTPWAETVVLKRSLSRAAARSPSISRIQRNLVESVKTAVANFKQNRVAPLVAKKPVEMNITFRASHFADAAELLPIVRRVGGLNVEYTASDMTEAYKIFELLVAASLGYEMMFQNLK